MPQLTFDSDRSSKLVGEPKNSIDPKAKRGRNMRKLKWHHDAPIWYNFLWLAQRNQR